MAERVLTSRALNRSVLDRQLLLGRSTLPIPRVLERVAGLQTQYAPTGYVGLWSRITGFRRSDLTKALETRRVVQGTLMRGTIHMVSRAEYHLFGAGTWPSTREWWARQSRRSGLDPSSYESLVPKVRERLMDGPARRSELIDMLVELGFPKELWAGLGFWLPMVRVPPSGTWERRRADIYALAEAWVGPRDASEAEGLEHLLKRYLRGFGPASLTDAANWAGVPVTTLQPVAERMMLRQLRDENGERLIDLPRLPIPDPDTPAPVRFLGTWEAVLLAHARRSQVLPEEYRGHVFRTRNPQSVATFLVDGSVAGTWRFDDGLIKLEPFDTVPRSMRAELEEETARLTAFHIG